ncbi:MULTISPECIES: hypothetical protein [Sphingomonas]|uniref:hypothetical protein n=1 Tax=Sphingomonas TaxID=13687 RepID=UPI0024137265|nr:hypothetical protein [Sphingomonas echinoides]
MAQYTGVLVRQNLQDQGAMPRTGGWTASPDVFSVGTQPTTNPQATYGSTTSYATDPTQPVVQNAPNYIYLRGKNLGTAATTGEAQLFYAPQSLFLYPVQWMNNQITTSTGANVSTIASMAPNAIGVTTDAFRWTPPTTSEHYCLVGFISTADFPFSSQQPPAAVSSMDQLAAWIGSTGGAGWHNVQWATNSATFTNTTPYPASSTAATVQLALTCTGLPVGSQVSFSSATPLPDGTYLNLPLTTVPTTGQIGFFIVANVPANWSTTISYSYYANGGTGLSTFNLAMSASIIQASENDVFAKYTRPSTEVFPNHQQFDHATGKEIHPSNIVVNYLIPVGSDVTMLASS